jgi:hypothetical protein
MFLETMFTLFLCHEPGQTANLGVFGAGNIVAAHAAVSPTAAFDVIGNGPDPSRISAVRRAIARYSIHRSIAA